MIKAAGWIFCNWIALLWSMSALAGESAQLISTSIECRPVVSQHITPDERLLRVTEWRTYEILAKSLGVAECTGLLPGPCLLNLPNEINDAEKQGFRKLPYEVIEKQDFLGDTEVFIRARIRLFRTYKSTSCALDVQ